jgi:hypothetical protein
MSDLSNDTKKHTTKSRETIPLIFTRPTMEIDVIYCEKKNFLALTLTSCPDVLGVYGELIKKIAYTI